MQPFPLLIIGMLLYLEDLATTAAEDDPGWKLIGNEIQASEGLRTEIRKYLTDYIKDNLTTKTAENGYFLILLYIIKQTIHANEAIRAQFQEKISRLVFEFSYTSTLYNLLLRCPHPPSWRRKERREQLLRLMIPQQWKKLEEELADYEMAEGEIGKLMAGYLRRVLGAVKLSWLPFGKYEDVKMTRAMADRWLAEEYIKQIQEEAAGVKNMVDEGRLLVAMELVLKTTFRDLQGKVILPVDPGQRDGTTQHVPAYHQSMTTTTQKRSSKSSSSRPDSSDQKTASSDPPPHLPVKRPNSLTMFCKKFFRFLIALVSLSFIYWQFSPSKNITKAVTSTGDSNVADWNGVKIISVVALVLVLLLIAAAATAGYYYWWEWWQRQQSETSESEDETESSKRKKRIRKKRKRKKVFKSLVTLVFPSSAASRISTGVPSSAISSCSTVSPASSGTIRQSSRMPKKNVVKNDRSLISSMASSRWTSPRRYQKVDHKKKRMRGSGGFENGLLW